MISDPDFGPGIGIANICIVNAHFYSCNSYDVTSQSNSQETRRDTT